MALYHCSVKIISRSDNKNAVAAAAYRSASVLITSVLDKETGLDVEQAFNYSNKSNVIFSEIIAPIYAPAWVYDRERLWNEVEFIEKRKDSQLAREIELALPIELDQEQNIELLRKYVQECFVDKGMIADVNVHWEDGNPHAHVMLTMRSINDKEFGEKVVSWNGRANILLWRETWANRVNQVLKQYGINSRVDHRSYLAQGIDLEATIHEGIGEKLANRVAYAERVVINQEIREENAKRIIDAPEIILDLVSSKYYIFSQTEIAKEVFNILERSKSFNTNEYFQSVFSRVLNHSRLYKVTESDLKGDTLYTLSERAVLEEDIWKRIEHMKDFSLENHAINISSDFMKQFQVTLSMQQIRALEHLVGTSSESRLSINGPGAISALVGRAGTGKSTIMKTVSAIYEDNGYRIIGGAVSGVATDNLARSCAVENGEFRTLTGWHVLLNSEGNENYLSRSGIEGNKTLFILDEASMIDIADLASIIAKIDDAGAKLIIIGDPDQLQPIGVGDGFKKIIEKIGAFELDQVWRQKDQWQQEATINLANGKIREAIKSYSEHSSLIWGDTREQIKNQLVQSYVNDFIASSTTGERIDKINSQYNTTIKSESSIVLGYTRAEVESLNASIREHLIVAGELVELPDSNGRYRTHDGVIDIAKGEYIVFTKNNTALGIYNGTRGIVGGVSSSNDKLQGIISVTLIGGDSNHENKTITINTSDYNHFIYGYATTIHKAQGLTVDKTYLLAEKHLNHNSFYVAASRHRSELKIFADKQTFKDIDDLAYKFARSHKDRSLISEYEIAPDKQGAYQKVMAYKNLKEEAADLYKQICKDSIKLNLSLPEHDQYNSFQEKCKLRTNLAIEIHENYSIYKTFLKQAGIDKAVVAKHARIEDVVLSKLDGSSTRLSLSSVSKGLNTGDFAVDHMSTQDASVSIKQIVKDLDKNIIPFSFEFISQTKTHEIAEQIFNLEEKFKLHSQRISGVEIGQVGESNFNLSVSNESNKSVIQNELRIYQDIRKINHLANNSSLYQQERQKIAFAVLNNKHLLNQIDLADVEKALISDRDQFVSQARELFESEHVKEAVKAKINDKVNEKESTISPESLSPDKTSIFVSSSIPSMSISQMYAALDSCDSQTKIKLTQSLNDKINTLSQLKQELCTEIKSVKTSILEAKNRISIADYKSELLNNYLGKVYRDPSSALLQWQVRVGTDQTALEESLDSASIAVKSDFRILGEPVGRKFLGLFSDTTRKQADALGTTISSRLVALENDKKQKQEDLAILEHYEQNKTLATLEKDLANITEQLGWIPNNSRVMNEIQTEAIKELSLSLHLDNDQSQKYDERGEQSIDQNSLAFLLQKENKNKATQANIDFVELHNKIVDLKRNIYTLNKKIDTYIESNDKIKEAVSKVYNHGYGFRHTIEIWDNNVKSLGTLQCEKMLNQNPTLLSELKGTSSFLGLIKDKDRVLAEQLSYNIGTALRNYTENLNRVEATGTAIESLKLKETSVKLEKSMTSEQIKEIVFENEYKRLALSQDNPLSVEQVLSIEKICSYVERYITYPGVLEKHNSHSLAKAAEFEMEQLRDNLFSKNQFNTLEEKLQFHIYSEIKAAIQIKVYLTHKDIQPYQAVERGAELFNKIEHEVNAYMTTLSCDHFENILKTQVLHYVFENNHIPNDQGLCHVIDRSEQIRAHAQELEQHLDKIMDPAIHEASLTHDDYKSISEFIAMKDFSNISTKSFREVITDLNKEIPELIQSKEQEKVEEIELGLELTHEK
jgi:Ti-type conjugative transfer relaxase TraA